MTVSVVWDGSSRWRSSSIGSGTVGYPQAKLALCKVVGNGGFGYLEQK